MAAPGKGSRWGSFISQAVAGVESRLDNILTEGEDGQLQAGGGSQQGQQAPQPGAKPPVAKSPAPQAPPATLKPAPATARSASSNRANDRLQARLAKAMAAKSAQKAAAAAATDPKPNASPRSSTDQSSRPSIDRPSMENDRVESKVETPASETPKSPEPKPATIVSPPATPEPEAKSESKPEPEQEKEEEEEKGVKPEPESKPEPEKETKSKPTSTTVESVTAEQPKSEPSPMVVPIIQTPVESDITPAPNPEPEPQPTETKPPEIERTLTPEPTPVTEPQSPQPKQTTGDQDAVNARQQEEIQEYVERIDSLQAKLQYLAKNAADAAKKATASAPAGSADRKLAEKDERIALLLEEGRKLSNTEQKYRTVIRKIRTQLMEHEKQIEELKKDKDKAAAETEALRHQFSNEEKETIQDEARKESTALRKEIDALKKANAAKDETIRRLEQDIKTNAEHAEASKAEALAKLQASERQKQNDLEESITNLQTEKGLLSNKIRLETLEWQEKFDRTVERGRNVEEELKHELRGMEGKLEAMRAAAEEASSGSGGEAQIKLLRQIETLQSQYASASDNWQGIETSLLAKVANLEKERDEAQRRESEMRKKARDAASRCRGLEDELQDVAPALATVQQELETCREQLAALRISSKTTETALEQAKADLEKQRSVNNREFPGEADRRQWVDDVTGSARNQSRPDSPLLSVPRTFSSDLVGGLPLPGRPRRVPTPGSATDSGNDGFFFGRRLSGQPPIRPSALASTSPGLPPMPFSPFEAPSESPHGPSPSVPDRDDDDNDDSSPRNVAHDMVSVSTVGAGPSVQLVERMSAAIRRLEAEKVAAKEEMARVCGQRDEARTDILGLMKDMDAAKTAAARVTELELEIAAINERYQTTLELLGEKSELVEELKADVEDVKDMYRELVERTVR